MELMFVYGSLRRGGHNHHYLSDQTFVLDGYVKGSLYLIEGKKFPALLPGDDDVFGELYRVDASTAQSIDDLEEYISAGDPLNLYNKVLVDVYDRDKKLVHQAYVYMFNPACPDVKDWLLIKSAVNEWKAVTA